MPDEEVKSCIQFLKNALPYQRDSISEKMELTFEYRRSIIDKVSILDEFPRFLGTPGLVRYYKLIYIYL